MDKPTLKPVTIKPPAIFRKIQRFPRPSPMPVLFFCMSILCARARLFGSINPFGGAFFAAIFSGKYTYIYMLGAILGQLSASAPLSDIGKYIFAMTIFALVCEKLPLSQKKKPSVRALLFALSLLTAGICFGFASNSATVIASYYDLMMLFVECAVAYCACAAFCVAVPVIKRMKLSYTFSSEEEISLISLLGCALWGAKSITDFGIINLSDIGGILIVLVFSIRLGSSRGAIAGLIMGFVSSLGNGRVDISCVSYAFSGLVAGFLAHYGNLCAHAGFIFANALVTALVNGSTEVLINIYDIFSACIIYSLIPEKVFLHLTNFGARDEKDRLAQDEKRYGEFVIANARKVVEDISKRFYSLCNMRESKNEAQIRFFERIARRSCVGCGMKRQCWSKDAKNTMTRMRYALGKFCETGSLPDEPILQSCLRPHQFREAFLQFSELYRNDIMWQGKTSELKKAATDQINAFSEILNSTGRLLSSSQSFDRALCDEITRKMDEADINCKNIVVMRDEDYDPVVMMSLSRCGGFSLCDKGVCEIVSAACGVKMIRAGKKDCATCSVRYVVAPDDSITFVSRKKARDKMKVSGDSALVRVIDKSLYAAVLTDGMGYGEKAYAESKAAAEMLLDLLEAGVDGEKAMKIVNSLLIPYGEATFSSADLLLYNPMSRRAKIIKCGSAATFSKSGERVDALYSKSMPLGSHIKSSVETFSLKTSSGDILVLISDGVLESNGKGAPKDTWLIKELENFSGNNVAKLADLICEKAMEKCDMAPKDDITVLAAYIE